MKFIMMECLQKPFFLYEPIPGYKQKRKGGQKKSEKQKSNFFQSQKIPQDRLLCSGSCHAGGKPVYRTVSTG